MRPALKDAPRLGLFKADAGRGVAALAPCAVKINQINNK